MSAVRQVWLRLAERYERRAALQEQWSRTERYSEAARRYCAEHARKNRREAERLRRLAEK